MRLIYFILLILFYQCHSNIEGGLNSSALIKLNQVETILLKFPDSILVVPGKVKLIHDNFYYLEYYSSSRVHIFDTLGNYIKSIAGIGEGPNRLKYNTAALVELPQGKIGFIGSTFTDFNIFNSFDSIVYSGYFSDKNGNPISRSDHLKIANWPFSALYLANEKSIIFPIESTIYSEFSEEYYLNPVLGIFDSIGVKRALTGRFDEIYLQNKYLPYLKDFPTVANNSKSGEILFSQQGTHHFQVYNYRGDFIKSAGIKGENINSLNYLPIENENLSGRLLDTYRTQSHAYFSINFDEKKNLIYRTYMVDVPLEVAESNPDSYFSRQGYIQVFDSSYNFLGEARIPSGFSFDIFSVYKGNIYFKNKPSPEIEENIVKILKASLLVSKEEVFHESSKIITENLNQITNPGYSTSIAFISPEINLIFDTTDISKRVVFPFRNYGNDTLRIQRIETGCDCLITNFYPKKIAPNSRDSIAIDFFPKYSGNQIREIRVYSNGNPGLSRLFISAKIN